jgi:hypothetical protein
MKKNLFTIFIIAIPFAASSQVLGDQPVNRSEYAFGTGPSNALTDIGGAAIDGSHFLRDFNSKSIRYGGFAGYRKKISRSFSVKGVLTLGELYGNDDLSINTFRSNRNQDFRTFIIEPSVQAEYHLIKPKKASKDTVTQNEDNDEQNNQIHRPSRWDLYVFGGLGFFYFNPQGKYNPGGPPPPPGMNTDEWYNLRPLSTEGEGLPGGPSTYSPFAICVPVGIGIKYALNSNWSVGLEFSDRLWTSTDYLDDTHGNYFNQATIAKYKGPIAAYFADPSKGIIQDQDLTGQERGNPKFNDSYMFMFLCVNYHPSFNFHRSTFKSRKIHTNHIRHGRGKFY